MYPFPIHVISTYQMLQVHIKCNKYIYNVINTCSFTVLYNLNTCILLNISVQILSYTHEFYRINLSTL